MSGERVGYGVSDEDLDEDLEERSEEQVRGMVRDRLEAKLGGDAGGAAVLEAVGDPSRVDFSKARWLTRSEEGDRDARVLMESCLEVVEEDALDGWELSSACSTVVNALADPLGHEIARMDGEDGPLSPKSVLDAAYFSTYRGLRGSVSSEILGGDTDFDWKGDLSSLRDLAGDLQQVRDSGVEHSPLEEGAGAGMLERLSAPESGAADGRAAWGMGDAAQDDARQVFDAFRDSVEGMSEEYRSTAAALVAGQLDRGMRESTGVGALQDSVPEGAPLDADRAYWEGGGAPYQDLDDADNAIRSCLHGQARLGLESGDRDEFLAGVEAARDGARAVDGYRAWKDA